jgi:hypothetical protein
MQVLVYYHQGESLPPWLFDNIEHTLRLHDNEIKMYLLTNIKVEIPGVEVIDISGFPKVPLKNPDVNGNPFWILTMLRFFDINYFIKTRGLTNVYHIESDCVPFTKLQDIIINDYSKFWVVEDCPGVRAIASIMFIPSAEVLQPFLDFIIESQKHFLTNEMNLLGMYPNKCSFPLFPGPGGCFDAAAISQFCFGTHQNPGVRFENESSILKVKDYKIEFKDSAVYLDNSKVHLLHFHDKRLKQNLETIRKLSLP